jgi:GGDEF domain-containing protein
LTEPSGDGPVFDGPVFDGPVFDVAAALASGAEPGEVLDAVARACVDSLGFRRAELRTPAGVLARAAKPDTTAETVPAGSAPTAMTTVGTRAEPVVELPVVHRGQWFGTLRLTPSLADAAGAAGAAGFAGAAGGAAVLDVLAGLAALALRLRGSDEQLAGEAARMASLREHVAVLRDAALSDPLTGLANRAQFTDRLRQALSRAARHGYPVGLLMVDLDGFKAVNDSFGHAAGDAVLREMAGCLRGCTRPTDTVARIGGDEFVVVLEDIGRGRGDHNRDSRPGRTTGGTPTGAEASVAAVARRVADALRVQVNGIVVGASVGHAVGTGTTDPRALLAAADASMYACKRSRRATPRPVARSA